MNPVIVFYINAAVGILTASRILLYFSLVVCSVSRQDSEAQKLAEKGWQKITFWPDVLIIAWWATCFVAIRGGAQ